MNADDLMGLYDDALNAPVGREDVYRNAFRTAIEQALEAARRQGYSDGIQVEQAQPVQGKPVAWRWSESEGKHWFAWTGRWDNHERAKELGCLIEYAYPPKEPT
jgi:hypothetical protein